MKGIYLLLGSNLGDRDQNLARSRELILDRCGELTGSSSIYESAPWGDENQPSFFNQIIRIETTLDPMALLHSILQIELDLGRKRFRRWGERLIDIDILYYGNLVLNTDQLTLPHPEIPNRRFALLPMTELESDFVHPTLNLDQNKLLEICKDSLWVRKLDPVSQ
jgi:2-amino-4-hydroxy-6-hydroxymethyldihydropteridine diphosphokinase